MRRTRHTKATLELQLQRTVTWSTAITKICKYFFSATATVAIFWFIFLSIDSLAGDETSATINVVFDVLKNRSIATFAPWGFGAGGIAYGWLQHRIRIAKVARLSEQNKLLERKLDKGRQSSRLNQEGSARREDV
jgi:hypothetical protein